MCTFPQQWELIKAPNILQGQHEPPPPPPNNCEVLHAYMALTEPYSISSITRLREGERERGREREREGGRGEERREKKVLLTKNS